MLVLARREGEAVRIGENIAVRVARIERGRVILAFDAPNDVVIHREEIHERINNDSEE